VADRSALLEAAERAITRGGAGVSMVAIADEAGVTKPILYRGVGDKAALVRALAERLVDRVAATVSGAVTSGGAEGVSQFVSAYLGHVQTERNLYLYVTRGDSGPESLQRADRAGQPLSERLAELRRSQGADPTAAITWAYATVGMLHFVTLWWLREGGDDVDAIAGYVSELLWSGLRGDGPVG
jgi:AcrR family transcriptional regulator